MRNAVGLDNQKSKMTKQEILQKLAEGFSATASRTGTAHNPYGTRKPLRFESIVAPYIVCERSLFFGFELRMEFDYRNSCALDHDPDTVPR